MERTVFFAALPTAFQDTHIGVTLASGCRRSDQNLHLQKQVGEGLSYLSYGESFHIRTLSYTITRVRLGVWCNTLSLSILMYRLLSTPQSDRCFYRLRDDAEKTLGSKTHACAILHSLVPVGWAVSGLCGIISAWCKYDDGFVRIRLELWKATIHGVQ